MVLLILNMILYNKLKEAIKKLSLIRLLFRGLFKARFLRCIIYWFWYYRGGSRILERGFI